MARKTERLTALKVQRETKPGMHHDGLGLYLKVGPTGGRSWVFRYTMNGVAHGMGLGGCPPFSLAEARERANAQRKLLADNIDPLAQRKQVTTALTFKQCTKAFVEGHKASWKPEAQAQMYERTMRLYVFPAIGDLPVNAVTSAHVKAILEPIWVTQNPTARFARAALERIISYATAAGFRSGPNPAQWRGHLENLFPKPTRIHIPRNHAALPYEQIPTFMDALRTSDALAARAFEFNILTATRSQETMGAAWAQIEGNVWTIPAARMKGGLEHRVALSARALELLKPNAGQVVFPGRDGNRLMDDHAFRRELVRLGYGDYTPHGFRSAFSTWAAEQTRFPREITEAALAHVVGNKAERTYARTDRLERRRALMDQWAQYCGGMELSNVTPIRARK